MGDDDGLLGHRSGRSVDESNAISWIFESTPTLLVAGSGISISAPACVPGVWPFLERTTAALQRSASYMPSDTGYSERLFPEACYGAIGEAFETDSHLKVWTVFDPQVAEVLGAHPNAGHLAFASLAAGNRWPILTTNFDCFLEEAARVQGHSVELVIPTFRAIHHLSQPPHATVIVKLHGSATDYRTIRATAADLSRCARLLRQLEFVPQVGRVLIAGYSGRDLDLFPWLADNFAGDQVLWIDRDFPAGHRAYALNALRWEGSWNDLAGRLLTRLGVSVPADGRFERDQVRSGYADAVTRYVERHITTLTKNHSGKAAAALAGTLASVAAHRDVIALASRYPEVVDEEARLQLLLWGGHSAVSTDRFDTARLFIHYARRSALRKFTITGWARSDILSVYSRVADRISTFREPRQPLFSLVWASIIVALPIITTTLLYFPLAVFIGLRVVRSDKRPPSMEYRFVCDYLEHLIRIAAVADQLPGRKRLRRRVLRQLSNWCSSVGYTWGVLNVAKYQSRDDGAFAGPHGAITLALLMGDTAGLALAYRDAALRLFADGGDGTAYLEAALDQAIFLGSPSQELKVRIARRRFGVDPPMPESELLRLIGATESKVLRREFQALRTLLCT